METDNYRKHTSRNPLQRLLVEHFYGILTNEIISLSPRHVLDVGCGEGFLLGRLRARKIDAALEGIEFNPAAITLGKTLHPDLRIRQGDIYHLPYSADACDVVVCSEVLEHLTHPEQALAELHRVTRSHCVVSVPNEPWFMLANFLRGKNLSRWGNDIEHIQHWSARGIERVVAKYFKIVSVHTPFPWTILVGKKV